jgi:hypothetical protein
LLVILASIYDESARHLVELWGSQNAYVLTCKDISVAGWSHYLCNSSLSTAVINGEKISNDQIDGVLTRLPYVTETELPHIVNHDRSYVAAEMMAFLVSWLSCLKCPVLNQPTPLCLLGPNWSQEQWIHTAAQIGIPVRSICRQSSQANIRHKSDDLQLVTVNVIGDHCYGALDDKMATQSMSLAHAAGVDMLSVHFTISRNESIFVGAYLWFPMDSNNISNAILKYFIDMRNKTKTQKEIFNAEITETSTLTGLA